MTTIKTDQFSGGAGLTPNNSAGTPDLATTLRDVVDDLVELRTKLILALAKLDDDATVTDTNYEALCSPVALKSIKG